MARGARPDYLTQHPTPDKIVLLVEVADTSTVKDLGEKAETYALAEVTDYWVVLVNEAVIVVHREPSPSGYRNVVRLAGSDTLSPLMMPEVVWTIHALLGERMDA